MSDPTGRTLSAAVTMINGNGSPFLRA